MILPKPKNRDIFMKNDSKATTVSISKLRSGVPRITLYEVLQNRTGLF